MGLDWTQVVVIGVPAYIAALGGAAAAIISSLNRRNLRTSNGHSIAETVEHTHEIAVATATAVNAEPPPIEEA